MKQLYFLKLGGSLITDKNQPMTVRQDILDQIAGEIAAAIEENSELYLVIGHGSGSFGHVAGKKHGTRNGVRSKDEWKGFAEVWAAARALNQIVVESLLSAGVPIIAFPPSSNFTAQGGIAAEAFYIPIEMALESKLVPLVNGDVVFDRERGGTILSTEDVFVHLAHRFHPNRILLGGIEAGVWRDYPERRQMIERIDRSTLPAINQILGGSAAVDVTGGMVQKVTTMVSVAKHVPGLEIQIFSGQEKGMILNALRGQIFGTVIAA